MIYTRILMILASSCLFACSGINALVSTKNNSQGEPAELVNYTVDERFVHIDVISNGCTLMTSFELLLVDKKTNSIQVMRKKPDSCNAKPIRVSLGYTYLHLGVDESRPVNLVNPIFGSDIASFD